MCIGEHRTKEVPRDVVPAEYLKGLGGGSSRRHGDVEENVGDDGPVEAKKDLDEKDQDPRRRSVVLNADEGEEEQRRAADQTDRAHLKITPRE